MRMFICLLLSSCFLFSACNKTSSIAVVNVSDILSSSPHAKQAEVEAEKAQEIYQFNLNVIEEKLATYKNEAQAKAWLLEAAQQLQAQLTNSRGAIAGAMAEALDKEIAAAGENYDVIFPKGILLDHKETLDISASVQERYDNVTVTWPSLPERIETPNLPADIEPEDAK